VHNSGRVLARIGMLAGRLASLYLLRYGPETGVELPPAVERADDHVPTLTAAGVIPVMPDNVTLQVVVFGSTLATTSSLASETTQTQPARAEKPGTTGIAPAGRPGHAR